MRILIDLDEIVVDLLRKWLRVYNHEWNDALTVSKITSFDITRCVKPECREKVYDIIRRVGFFDHLQPLPGAVEGVKNLVAAGHGVYFASDPAGGDSARAKIEWVIKHFGWSNKLLLLRNKHWLDADLLIDDKPRNIVAWARKPGCATMTIAYPYNKNVQHLTTCYAESYTDTTKAWETLVSAVADLAYKMKHT